METTVDRLENTLIREASIRDKAKFAIKEVTSEDRMPRYRTDTRKDPSASGAAILSSVPAAACSVNDQIINTTKPIPCII